MNTPFSMKCLCFSEPKIFSDYCRFDNESLCYVQPVAKSAARTGAAEKFYIRDRFSPSGSFFISVEIIPKRLAK